MSLHGYSLKEIRKNEKFFQKTLDLYYVQVCRIHVKAVKTPMLHCSKKGDATHETEICSDDRQYDR